ncbi:MAG: hypothetical protein ACI4GV_04925 [Acutalibacteraceae bacterium]
MRRKSPKNEKITYENRYKYKLNMLEPGQIMMKIAGVLLLLAIIFRLVKWQAIAVAALIPAGLIFAVLLILVAIELYQDKVLNDIAMHENKEKEKQ